MSKFYNKIPTYSKFTPLKVFAWRTGAVFICGLSAMGIPRLGLFLNLVGSLSCTALAFILPVLIYNKLFESELHKYRKWFHLALMVFGAIAGAMSFAISIYNLWMAFGNNKKEGE